MENRKTGGKTAVTLSAVSSTKARSVEHSQCHITKFPLSRASIYINIIQYMNKHLSFGTFAQGCSGFAYKAKLWKKSSSESY
jgi:hypothetical protein